MHITELKGQISKGNIQGYLGPHPPLTGGGAKEKVNIHAMPCIA